MEIKRKRNHFTFIWAITKVMEKGTEWCKELTDDDIEECYQSEIKRQETKYGQNEFCIYTPEVVRDMLITARELANLDFEELINGMVKADLWKAHRISYDRMSEIASKAIDGLIEDDEYEAKIYLREEVELDEEESEYFGVDLSEDREWEE